MPIRVEKEEKKKKKEKGRGMEQKADRRLELAGFQGQPAHREASRRHRGGRQERRVNGSGGGWDFKGSPSLVLSQPAGPVLDKLMTLSSDLSSAFYVNATCIEHRKREVVNEEEITLIYCSLLIQCVN